MLLVRKLCQNKTCQRQESLQSGRQLRRQLRSDRNQLDSVYSAQLSHYGTAFHVGDHQSRLSLRKLVRKIEATIKKVVGMLKYNPASPLDYPSLLSLSQSSRKSAMCTITSLSSKVDNDRLRREEKSSRASNSSSISKQKKSKRKGIERSCEALSQTSRRTGSKGGFRGSTSIETMHSDSTKIGEIRRRRQTGSVNQLHVHYPIRSLERRGADVKGRSWWNRFRSRN